jgi:hypothetical protein
LVSKEHSKRKQEKFTKKESKKIACPHKYILVVMDV